MAFSYPSRRSFMVAGAAVAGALSTTTRASPLLTVPVVDSLSTQVLVDSAQFGPFLDDVKRPGLLIERSSSKRPPAARMTGKTLEGQFGLSLLNESRMVGQTRRILIDFGFTYDVLANNITELGIDPTQIDAAVLSHGHIDHYGGYRGLFAARKPDRPLPLYVGEEEAFCERTGLGGNPPIIMGALDRAGLSDAGFVVLTRPDPVIIADQAFTTGIIPMSTAERAAIPTQMRPGVGCEVALLSPSKRDKALLQDDGEHELATAYVVKGLGLVVISSCGHRGILNTIRQAQRVSGVEKIHAVMGGFHLVRPRTEEEAKATAAALKDINPNYIIPMHCTGEVFITEATRLMPGKVIRPYVGNRITFSL
ncbi:MBL fold metallo-hydrolase [Asticcacaulis sp. 201]|uniref:MBL fold metallo-hydrolase n=1 Tax=Asticcacaulis sp. 201 TaxID=3028787 RepID=UPI002916ECEC|nr:MBL fold metallo-hydrolase [Asticcacaulis sp. 201]MDV6331026.1 MBL fold metallo-hydrolase [Asticcacaulis sp. 201]